MTFTSTELGYSTQQVLHTSFMPVFAVIMYKYFSQRPCGFSESLSPICHPEFWGGVTRLHISDLPHYSQLLRSDKRHSSFFLLGFDFVSLQGFPQCFLFHLATLEESRHKFSLDLEWFQKKTAPCKSSSSRIYISVSEVLVLIQLVPVFLGGEDIASVWVKHPLPKAAGLEVSNCLHTWPSLSQALCICFAWSPSGFWDQIHFHLRTLNKLSATNYILWTLELILKNNYTGLTAWEVFCFLYFH